MQNRKTSLEFKTGNQSRSPIRSMMKVIEDEFGPIRNFYEEWSAASDARRPYLIAQTQQERWEGLKVFYAFYLDEILQSPHRRWVIDPYELPFLNHASPIEQDAWQCIRIHGLVMYPQFPTCGFFLDYAHPVIKVAIEMDGKEWHDAAKDAARDRNLIAEGWTIYRIPGGHCKRQLLLPSDLEMELRIC